MKLVKTQKEICANIYQNLPDLDERKTVLSICAFPIRRKTSGFDYIKMKHFCVPKSTMSQIKGK